MSAVPSGRRTAAVLTTAFHPEPIAFRSLVLSSVSHCTPVPQEDLLDSSSGAGAPAPAGASAAEGDGPAGSVVGGAAPPHRSLRAYLALPLEEYALLDPRYIARLGGPEQAAGGSGGTGLDEAAEAGGGAAGATPASGSFLLTVPLIDIVGLDLTPQLAIDVDVDERAGQVRRIRCAWIGARGKPSRAAHGFTVYHLPLSNPPARPGDVHRWQPARRRACA